MIFITFITFICIKYLEVRTASWDIVILSWEKTTKYKDSIIKLGLLRAKKSTNY
jgi:hypothetical protein